MLAQLLLGGGVGVAVLVAIVFVVGVGIVAFVGVVMF